MVKKIQIVKYEAFFLLIGKKLLEDIRKLIRNKTKDSNNYSIINEFVHLLVHALCGLTLALDGSDSNLTICLITGIENIFCLFLLPLKTFLLNQINLYLYFWQLLSLIVSPCLCFLLIFCWNTCKKANIVMCFDVLFCLILSAFSLNVSPMSITPSSLFVTINSALIPL